MKLWLGQWTPYKNIQILGGLSWDLRWWGITFGQTFVGIMCRQKRRRSGARKGGTSG